MKVFDARIRLWTGQEKLVPKIIAPDENNARQHIHDIYGSTTEIVEISEYIKEKEQ